MLTQHIENRERVLGHRYYVHDDADAAVDRLVARMGHEGALAWGRRIVKVLESR